MQTISRAILVLLFTFTMTTSDFAASIAKDGKSDYVIVLPSDAIPAEKTAAKELQEHLKEITGATLEIRSEDDTTTLIPQILVGPSKRARQSMPCSRRSTASPRC